MSRSDERKRLDKKLNPDSPSSAHPENRNAKREELKKKVTEASTKNELSKLQLEKLRDGIQEQKERSKPVQDRKKEVADGNERDGNAKEYNEKMHAREEGRQAAISQAVEEQGDSPG